MAARPGAGTRFLLSLPTLLFLGAALMSIGLRWFRSSAAVDAQQRLYRAPAGLYSQADIQANGTAPPSVKFHGILANHHLQPTASERICPITRTRANPRFAWSVGGRKYLFCCPPCIDEFVQQARTAPATIRPPEAYVQR